MGEDKGNRLDRELFKTQVKTKAQDMKLERLSLDIREVKTRLDAHGRRLMNHDEDIAELKLKYEQLAKEVGRMEKDLAFLAKRLKKLEQGKQQEQVNLKAPHGCKIIGIYRFNKAKGLTEIKPTVLILDCNGNERHLILLPKMNGLQVYIDIYLDDYTLIKPQQSIPPDDINRLVEEMM